MTITIIFNNFGRDPPLGVYLHEFWGANLVCSFGGVCRLKLLLPYSSGLTKMKKEKMEKIQTLKFHNSSNNFGRDNPYEYA